MPTEVIEGDRAEKRQPESAARHLARGRRTSGRLSVTGVEPTAQCEAAREKSQAELNRPSRGDGRRAAESTAEIAGLGQATGRKEQAETP